jgi:hypothetical protein
MSKRTVIVTAGLVGALAAALSGGIVSANGGAASSTELHPWGFGWGTAPSAPLPHIKKTHKFRLRAQGFTATMLDNDPAGFSQGDEIIVEGQLVGRGGEPEGRIEVHEVLTGLSQSGGGRLQLFFTALMARGQITGSGVLNISQSGPSNARAAILGGTGHYRNVRGEVYIHPGQQSSRLTFYLVP